MRLLYLFLILFSTPILLAQDVIKNEHVVEMINLGFSKDIIISKIQTSKVSFDTSLQALSELKNDSVDNDIISAMVKSVPYEEKRIGIYVKNKRGFNKILSSSFTHTETNTMVAVLTSGIASSDIKSSVLGAHSRNVLNTNIPKFYFFMDARQISGNMMFSPLSSPYEFVLVKLVSEGNRREIYTGSANLYSGQSVGLDNSSVVKFTANPIGENSYEILLEKPLSPGEYCFVYMGAGENSGKTIFDFAINKTISIVPKYKIGDTVWIKSAPFIEPAEITAIREIDNKIIYTVSYHRGSLVTDKYEYECFTSKEEARNINAMNKKELMEQLNSFTKEIEAKDKKISQLEQYVNDLKSIVSSLNKRVED